MWHIQIVGVEEKHSHSLALYTFVIWCLVSLELEAMVGDFVHDHERISTFIIGAFKKVTWFLRIRTLVCVCVLSREGRYRNLAWCDASWYYYFSFVYWRRTHVTLIAFHTTVMKEKKLYEHKNLTATSNPINQQCYCLPLPKHESSEIEIEMLFRRQ